MATGSRRRDRLLRLLPLAAALLAWFPLSAVAQVRAPHTIAFVVGIEHYDDSELDRLQYAADDAKRVFEQLKVGSLAGTAWQLVSFRSADGNVVTPDDRAKYTIRFGTGGEVILRVDCNRGRGKWESTGSQLRLGPLALTRMKCPQGSMHDLFVKHWTSVASYNIKDRHLFLLLERQAGSYEFEPTKAGQ